MTGQRVMVCGSRSWDDGQAIHDRLARLPADTIVVHGACPRGADALADRAAKALHLTRVHFPARWRTDGYYNPRAGFDRNDVMLDSQPPLALVIAFRAWGKSNGTDHAIQGAQQRGLPLEVHRPAAP